MKTNTPDSLVSAKSQFMHTLRKQEINELLDQRRKRILGHDQFNPANPVRPKTTSAEVASQLLDPERLSKLQARLRQQ